MSMISNNVLSLVNKCVLNPHKSNLKNIDLRGNCRSFFFTFFIYNFNLPRIFHFMDWCSVLLTFLYSFFSQYEIHLVYKTMCFLTKP